MTAAMARRPLRESSACRNQRPIMTYNGSILRTVLAAPLSIVRLAGEPKPLAPAWFLSGFSASTKLCMQNRRDDQLGNAHAARDRERFRAEIDQNDLYFAAIVGIDRCRAR